MALGTLAATALQAAPAIIGAFGSGNDTSVKTPQVATRFPTLSAGGLTATASDRNVNVASSSGRKSLVSRTSKAFRNQARTLAGLRGRVAPGVSDLRASRLAAVGDARSRAIGNLRENLQRRRVLGSSFGQDALTRTEAEFGRERDRVESETFLQELELTTQLLDRETKARTNSFQTRLNELNLQADLAQGIGSQATTILNQTAQLQASLALRAGQFNAKSAQQSSAGAGQFFGQAIAPLLNDQSNLQRIGQNFAASTTVT